MKEFKNKHFKIISFTVIVSLMFIDIVCASSGGGHETASSVGWSKIDSYKLLNFGVLFIALIYLLKKPLSEFLSSRIKNIKEELKDLEQQKVKAEQQLSEYEAKFNSLDKEAEKIIQDYIAQGEEAKKRILAEAEAQAEKLESKAKLNIEQEFNAAKVRLKEEIVEQALEKAEELVKKSISSNDQETLVNEYLEKVVA